MTDPQPTQVKDSALAFGTEANPLVHPVTGERIVFRTRSQDSAGQFLELNLYLAPGGFIAATHVHPKQEERFEIGGAEVMFRIGKETRQFKPGEVAVVPPGTPHVWWNPSQTEAATLIRFTPALNTETFFETLFGLAEDGKVGKNGLPNLLQLSVLAREYRHEMQLPPPMQWVLGPLTMALAPIARLAGYRGRYERYSGPAGGGKAQT